MRRKILFLISCALLFAALLRGQCPHRDTLRKRILYLRDYLKPPPLEQLKELLGYVEKMSNCPYKNDSTHVFLLGRIGDIYFKQADYLKSVQYRQQAIDIITANASNPSVKPKTLPGRYYYLSIAYDSLNNFTGKMKALDSCFAIAMRLKHMDRASLTALYTRVEYYYDIGDYHRCIDYAEKCGLLANQFAGSNTGTEKIVGESYASSSLGWRIIALLRLNKYSQAEDLLKNKVDEFRKAGLKDYLGMAYGQLAEVQKQKGNYEKAIYYYDQSLKCYKEINDYFNCKQTLKDIGYNIYFRYYNDNDKALAYYKKALKYKYVTEDQYWIAADKGESLNIYTLIANVYVQKGLFDSAYYYFRLAFDQLKPGSDEKEILQSAPAEFAEYKNMHYLAGLFIDKGDALKLQFKANKQISTIRDAIKVYWEADKLLDKIRIEQTDLQSKLFWRSDSRRLYEHAIDACYLQGNTADAFYFFEKSRAVLLSDQLNEQRWVGENDILKQTQLKKKILRIERELNSSGASADHYTRIKAEIFTSKQELDRLEQLIKDGNPLYYQSFLDTGSITLKYVQQKLLKEHHALLEIFSGDSAVYSLLVTDKNSYLTKINKPDFETTAGKYLSYISNADLMNRQFDGFVSVSNHLYNLLFQNSVLPGNRIIISPDGQYFPFEALVTSRTNQQHTYFLKDHAVSYTYSARFLMNDFRSGSASTGKNFMGMAPVNYPSSFSLASLPGSDRSLRKIAGYFDNAVNRSAAQASRNYFMQQFSQYRIIQLYTHAADSSSNNEPVIYFADSALYLSDLINAYKPLTRLVVLSACETGTGKIYQGEGVFSFNRGFAALGIPAAITNLWSVDNESTYLLTELFYKWLSKGLPTDVALQKAKLEFLQAASLEKSMPCYWAGPVLVGKTDIIELRKSYPWKWIVLFLIGCIVFFAVRKWAISKRME